MGNYAVQVNDIGKQYNIFKENVKFRTLRDKIMETVKSPIKTLFNPTGSEKFWALRHVSFDLEHGRVLGIIGKNGAGKSTLLKILSRVVEPTEGLAEIHGRVGSLLEVGTGFHPELTGRENIYLNGAILGMKRTEIDRKFDEIVAFSEIDKFIDTPVKRYSSGMYMRLAFAVSAHLEPEILVVDEVLAVGDAEFQRKCLGKMSDVASQGRTVLFVSHNMSAIQRLTQECIVLDKGGMVMRAPTAQAVDYYLTNDYAGSGERIYRADEIPSSSAPFKPIAVRVKDKQNRITENIISTEPMTVEVEYALDANITGLRVGVYLLTTRGEFVFTSFDTDDSDKFQKYSIRKAGRYFSRVTIPANTFNEGRFVIGINASSYMVKRYFGDERSLNFNVDPTGAPGMQWVEVRQGPIRPRLDWRIEEA